MAITASVSVAATFSGDGENGTLVGQPAANNAAPPATIVQLSVGSNTFTYPTGFTITGVVIIPPPTSANTKTLKGNGSDIGFPGWTSQPVVVPVGAGALSLAITSAGTETVKIAFF